MRTFLAWIVYLSFVAVATIVMAEGAVRLLGIAPPLPTQFSTNVADAYLPWKPEPLSVSEGSTPEFRFSYRHNTAGFRDSERAVRKPPGVFRILAVGDSFTYGVGVSIEETFVSRLERMLNTLTRGRPQVEVINVGIPRYWPEAERILLERYGLEYQPDVVLVGFVPNDVIDTHVGLHGLTVSQGFLITSGLDRFGSAAVWLHRHSHLFRSFFTHYLARADARRPQTAVPAASNIYEPNGLLEDDWRKVESEYDRMADAIQDAGAAMALVFLAPHAPWPPTAHQYPQRRLATWCASRGVTCIDTAPALTAGAAQTQLYYPVDGHPNPAGHALIAEAIYTALAPSLGASAGGPPR